MYRWTEKLENCEDLNYILCLHPKFRLFVSLSRLSVFSAMSSQNCLQLSFINDCTHVTEISLTSPGCICNYSLFNRSSATTSNNTPCLFVVTVRDAINCVTVAAISIKWTLRSMGNQNQQCWCALTFCLLCNVSLGLQWAFICHSDLISACHFPRYCILFRASLNLWRCLL